MKKLDYIDGVRGWAIILVLIVHSQFVTPAHDSIQYFIYHGAMGVQLFFIVSAFTLFYSLENRKNVDKKPILSFFIRRFFRIAPFFYIMMIFSLLYYGLSPRFFAPEGISKLNIFLTTIFLNGWWPTFITSIVPGGWSIAVEMNFYLLIPLLFKYIKNTISALCITIISYFLLNAFVLRKISPFIIERFSENDIGYAWVYTLSFPVNFYIFCIGIVLFFLHKKNYHLNSKISTILFYFSFTLLVYCLSMPTKKYNIFISMFIFVFFASKVNSKIVTGNFIRFIGKISFSLYFIHFYIYEIIGEMNFFDLNNGSILASLFATTLCLILSIPIALFTYKYIEQKSINIGKQFIEKINAIS